MKLKALALMACVAFGFDYSDEFNSLNKDFWLVFSHGTYHYNYFPPAYEKAEVNNGVLSLVVRDIDAGPELINKQGIKISPNDKISLTWRAKVHYANEYFTGRVALALVNYEEAYDPHSSNYNIPPYTYYDPSAPKQYRATYLAQVFYHNYFYGNYPPPYTGNNFGFCGTISSYEECDVIDPIWDRWFTTKVELDLPNQTARIWIDGELKGEQRIDTQKVDLTNRPYLKIHFSPYGWYDGHEMDLDFFKISISSNQCSGDYEAGYEQGVKDTLLKCQQEPSLCIPEPPTTPLLQIEQAISGRSFPIKGYFIHYDQGHYDWLFVTPDLQYAAKLEGMFPDGSLKWTFIQTPSNPTFQIYKEGDFLNFYPLQR